MIRALLLSLALATPAFAECNGRNLIDTLPGERRAELDAAVAAQPFASGNRWLAVRGDERLTIVGTYHMNDPRLDVEAAALQATVADAATVLVEAGPDEEAQLLKHMGENPALVTITDGPTIPEQLSEEDWSALGAAVSARGIPPFMAAKFQPWYLSMMLSIPPCQSGADATFGFDKRIIALAKRAGTPIAALEPWDTVLGLFAEMPPEEQLDMIRMTLPMEKQSADYAVTLADSYFAGDARQMWEFMRLSAADMPGYDTARADAEFAQMEHVLMVERNRAWIPVIEAAAEHGPVLAAFGALHLAGHDGVLNLLRERGFEISPLP
ncbi:TraB/GumN family protein [Falsirhodobacter xinxiangensis]|uniref:TraB/GumN family protein n=1 Tax=Falsirhodobacter xinxiangensis TaxID=2530049 RepID=UPI0010AA11DC|nr:TraB/GumN family protein [Rhodobacter xinxiangensis]